MGWRLALRPTPEWDEPYGSRGHGQEPVADRRTAMGQCASGWQVVPHRGLSYRPWAGYKGRPASENGLAQIDYNGHSPKFLVDHTVC
jgi:hypothetical protein